MLEKPSELVLFRGRKDRGLGLVNVKIKALALLIKAFIETSICPKFRHSLYHEILFRYYVLDETSITNPGLPPYYDQGFFDLIKSVHFECPLNIAFLSTKQWYRLLLERVVLNSPATDNEPERLLPVRCESLQPDSNWSYAWHLTKTPGLPSNTSSFLFKLLHLLLPTQDRVHRIGVEGNSNRGQCLSCKTDSDSIQHSFFSCSKTSEAGLAALGWARAVVPELTQEQAVRLDVGVTVLGREEELVLTTILGISLQFIWEARIKKKRVETYEVRSELEAAVSLL